MKTTVNNYQFHRAFEEMNRTNNFTYAGLNALFDYLEQYEEESGEELELNVIAFCCDFAEYENLAEFRAYYGEDYETIGDIRDKTILIDVDLSEDADGVEDGRFIIQAF